jgi:hypothetical protein
MVLHCVVCCYGRFEGIPASIRNAGEYSLDLHRRRRKVVTFSVQVGLAQLMSMLQHNHLSTSTSSRLFILVSMCAVR